MRFIVFAAALSAALAAAPPARADVTAASPGGFMIEAEAQTTATPERAWRALSQLGRWWNGEHTYSGDARRMRLDPRAGGCWCETWGNGQSVEHGRVVLVMERDGVRTVRLAAALGPLQELAVDGALTFTIAPHADGAKITMTYRVSGDSSAQLDQLAPLVDMVMMEQFGRLIRYSSSGSPG